MLQPHKIAVVVNPYSGNGRAARRWPRYATMIEDKVREFFFPRATRGSNSAIRR